MKNILIIFFLLCSSLGFAQIQTVNIGNALNDKQGDKTRDAFRKVNQNFDYLDERIDDMRDALDSTAVRLDSLIDAGPGGGGGTWGTITGTLSDQTDLNSALGGKQATLVSGTNIKTLEGVSLLGSTNIDLVKGDVGLGNVDNTTDLGKPISTLTQTALNGKLGTTLTAHTNITGAFSLGLNHSGDNTYKLNVHADATANTAAFYSNAGTRFATFFGSGSFELNGPMNLNSTANITLGSTEEFIISKEDASGNSVNFGITEAPTSGGTTSLEVIHFGPASIDNYSYMKVGDYSSKLGLINFGGTEGVYLEASTLDEGNLALQVVDTRPVPKGLQAAATGYVTDPLSYTTKEYVDAATGGGGWATTGTTELTGPTIIEIADNSYSMTWDDGVNGGSFAIEPFTSSKWESHDPSSPGVASSIEMAAAGAQVLVSSPNVNVFVPSTGSANFGVDFGSSPTTYAGLNVDGPSNSITMNATDIGVSNSFVVSTGGIEASSGDGKVIVSAGDVQLEGNSGTLVLNLGSSGFEFTGGNLEIPNGQGTLNFPSTNAQSSSDLTITYTGAVTGDMVILGVPQTAVTNNSCYTAWVSSNNTITVRFNNYSSAAIDPASATFKATVIK